jgi:hypothetical protein
VHYWIQVLCRGLDTLGKEGFALDKGFADCSFWQRPVGTVLISNEGFADGRLSAKP